MIELYQKMIEGMTKESKAYYIKLGVKFGDLTRSQAGFLVITNGLL